MSKGYAPSRRDLVRGGAVLAAALPAASASTAFAKPFPHQDAADWKKQVGMTFAIAGEAGTAPMRLIDVKGVTRLRAPGAGVRDHSFTALFEMDAARAPAGGKNYLVRHPELGTTGLYLERTTFEDGRAHLRASFN
jgi:hypothetical protein